jgi:hypothetical protein
MDSRDHGLATEIALGCLRRQGELDQLLAEAAGRSLAKLDPEVRAALRIGCYQLRFLDRIPARAAVSESVELVKMARKRSVESDLGEYIIQLAGEAPSHIVMPCIHKNTGEIAELFAKHIEGQAYTEDVDVLTAAARRVLREQFAAADAGITGANFLVAETGSLVLTGRTGVRRSGRRRHRSAAGRDR